MANLVPISIKGKNIKIPKAINNPNIGERTVLTSSPWDFVSLWLKKQTIIMHYFIGNKQVII